MTFKNRGQTPTLDTSCIASHQKNPLNDTVDIIMEGEHSAFEDVMVRKRP
jgi:hypothetical protein